MSSIWSNAAAPASSGNPFALSGAAPSPGGGAASKFQSLLQSSGASSGSKGQLGLSPQASVSTMAAASSGSSSSADSADAGATVTANDFLTLLVTEMQNQDPTADVDPNEYINQLVQINSLEQLISINQNLEEVLGAASSASTGGSSGTPSDAATIGTRAPHLGTHPRAPSAPGFSSAGGIPAAQHAIKGNLSVPPGKPAARAVAQSLNGNQKPAQHGHAIRDIPTRPLA